MGIIFPLITFPYASRILLPEGIGRVDFARSVIAYFIILSTVGIPLYGVREVAKVRDNKDKLSKLAQELFILNIFFTIISYIILFAVLQLNDKLYAQRELIVLMSTVIIFTTIGIEWLYQALEEYLYITVRTIIFQILSMILLFTFVRSKEDYLIYAGLNVFSSVGSNIINFIHARKYISLKRFKKYDFKKHLKPIFTIFGMNLAVSIYVNLDSVMLGLISGNAAVGIYSAAIKINKVVLAVVTSLGTVLLPRSSYYFQNGRIEEFNNLILKAIDFIMLLAIPAGVGLFLLSNEIILIFSGTHFSAAGLTMKILTPIIFIIGLSNLIGIQILVPTGREKYTFYSVLVGAITNFTLNYFLIRYYAQNGAAVATLIAESCVTIIQIYFAWHFLKDKLFTKSKIVVVYETFAIFLIVFTVKQIFTNNIYIILISVTLALIAYSVLLTITKNSLFMDGLNKLFRRKVDVF
jgi:O-antigen/teichoic acid export membrane protein